MTVGLYINAPVPIVISDCLALPVKAGKQVFSPSNIEHFDGVNGELAELVSKFGQFDDQTIITFSGRSDDIGEFTNYFPQKWKDRDQNLRPMEFLKKTDSDLRAVRPGWNCSVLGASVMPITKTDKRCLVNNYASKGPDWKFPTRHFGDCYAIGSGSGALRSLLENADENIENGAVTGVETIFQLIGALNGKSLYFQNVDVEKQTWGGLMQAQIYINAERKWFRTPNWFHCCLRFIGPDLKYLGLHPKLVLHASKENTINTSGIFTIVKGTHRGDMKNIWPVYSPFFFDGEDKKFILDTEIFKSPSMITISVEVVIDGRLITNHFTNSAKFENSIKFKKDGIRFEFEIDQANLSNSVRKRMFESIKF